MVYEVMQIRKNRKSKNDEIRKYQFDSKERADNFAKASQYPTQVYKLEKIAEGNWELEQTDTLPGRTSVFFILMVIVIALALVWMPLLCLGVPLRNAKELIKNNFE